MFFHRHAKLVRRDPQAWQADVLAARRASANRLDELLSVALGTGKAAGSGACTDASIASLKIHAR